VREGVFQLRPKSAAWRNRDWASLSELSLTVDVDGHRLGGHNVQVVLGAPDRDRSGLDEDVVLWLDSGWWVTLRNQFAQAPSVAATLLRSGADELSRLTDRVTAGAPRAAGGEFWQEVAVITIEVRGPNCWR
jgi:hypothetical protein